MISKFSLRSLGLLAFSLVLTLTSLAAYSPTDHGGDRGYSGDQLVRGIFFMQGPVADRIPVLQEINIGRFIKDNAIQDQIIHFQEQVIAEMQIAHPDFAQELEEAVASGSSFRIHRMLDKGNEIITAIATELSEAEKARQQALAAQRSDQEAAAPQTFTSQALAEHLWDLLPVCLLRGCVPDPDKIVIVRRFEMPEEGLFREQLVSEIAHNL